MARVLGIDVGASQVKMALVDGKGQTHQLRTFETRAELGKAHLQGRLLAAVADYMKKGPLAGIGLAFCGIVGPASQRLGPVPNLPDWQGTHLASFIREGLAGLVDGVGPASSYKDSPLLNFPIWVENDARAAAYGEWAAGGGQGIADFFYLTLSTGVGGGRVKEGVIERGKGGYAGEVGHLCLVPGGRTCSCGRQGCWQAYGSGRALEKEARRLWQGSSSELTAKAVFLAYEKKDPRAQALIEEVIDYTVLGIYNLATSLNPQAICLGGGLGLSAPWFFDRIEERLTQLIPQKALRPRLLLAKLGSASGLVGAGLLVHDTLSKRRGDE